MNGLKGFFGRAELPFGHDVRRQRLQILPFGLVQSGAGPFAQLILAEALAGAINGQQAAGGLGIGGRLEHRVDHPPAPGGKLRLAEEDAFLAPL